MISKLASRLPHVPSLLLVVLCALAQPSTAAGCSSCHDGSDPSAPNVMTYWNGDWWDTNMGGNDATQQGGHGDPDRRAASTCDGDTGCHDLTDATTHNNGILETIGFLPSANTAHLRSEFLPESPLADSSVAEAFNTTCARLCHPVLGPRNPTESGDGHAKSSPIPYTGRFGYGITPADADGSDGPRKVRYWVDSDISTDASRDNPDFPLCVTCHDPHGTAIFEPSHVSTNKMMRDNWGYPSTLCYPRCHDATPGTPPPFPAYLSASDGDYPDRIRLTWGDVEGESGYRIYRSAAPTGPFTPVGTTVADITTLDDSVPPGIYYYRVVSYLDGFASAMSSADAGSTQGVQVPVSVLSMDWLLLLLE